MSSSIRPPKKAAIVDPVLEFRSEARAHRHALGRRNPRLRARARARRRMDPRHPSARRPFHGGRLSQAEAQRAAGDRREGARDRRALARLLSPAERSRRRCRFRPAVRRRRHVQAGRARCARHAVARPHARLDHLRRRRRCRLRARYADGSRFRLLARRFPRRRRRPAVPLDQGDPGIAGKDPAVRRPRLLQGRPRAGVGSHRRRAQGVEHPRQGRHLAKPSS